MTLVELMVTLTVAAILVTIAIPSFQTFITKGQLTTSADAVVAGLNLAKSEALRTGSPVMFCAATGGFTAGWSVSASCPVAAPTDVFRTGALSNANLIMNGLAGVTSIAFDGQGRLMPAGTLTAVQLMICLSAAAPTPATASGTSQSRDVIVAPNGGISIAQTDPVTGNPQLPALRQGGGFSLVTTCS